MTILSNIDETMWSEMRKQKEVVCIWELNNNNEGEIKLEIYERCQGTSFKCFV